MSETSAQRLRQKAISLLYLIFLALIFFYIPSDFVDAVQKSDQTMSVLCSEVEMQTNRYNAMVLSHLKNDPSAFEKTKHKIFEIDQKTTDQIDKIDQIKLNLIKKEGYNQFGYLNGGKREKEANDLLIYGKEAEEMFEALRNFKLDISQYVEVDQIDQIDSIMPLREFELRSNGDPVKTEQFYFYKHPLTISLLGLSSFKSKVELIRSYVVNTLIANTVSNGSFPIPSEIRKVIQADNQVIGSKDFIPIFMDEVNWDSVIVSQSTKDLERQQSKNEADQYEILIESRSDSVYAVGQPIRFDFTFDETTGRRVSVDLEKPNGEHETYTLSKPGTFLFVPERKGYYQLRFGNGTRSGRKIIKVLDLDPVLANDQMGTLYIGINNALQLKTSEFEDTEGLQARISEGQILKKGKNFYARVFEEGQVRIEIFAKMPYGFVKVAEKQYVVRHLNPPVANILDIDAGSTVKHDDIVQAKRLSIKSDELLVEEEFYIESFDFTIIYNDHTAILRPVHNQGNSLNPPSLEALSKVTDGDIIMFNNIKAKSSLGTEIDLNPVTYTIKN